MNVEQKQALGYLIRRYRERKGWTQEVLEEKSGVNWRTIQRAEAGLGLNSFNLGSLAKAFDMDVCEMLKQAEKVGAPSPEKRIALKEINTPQSLLKVVGPQKAHVPSLELGLPEEHPYNEMVGEDIIELSEEMNDSRKSAKDQATLLRMAQFILSMCKQMGFILFAGDYIELHRTKNASRRKRVTLIIAAPMADPRIVRTRSGMELDVIRDSRKLLLGGLFAGHTTTYNWLEHQFLSKSDGEERVTDAFRRIMAKVISEMNTVGRSTKQS